MPKIPDGKKMVKNLEKYGFHIDRQSGSHVILKNDKGLRMVVPVHAGKELKIGLYKSLLKDINLDEDQFWKI